jgi:hypothetical protein
VLSVPRALKSFWPHPMDLLGDVGQMEAHFGPFGDNVNSTQDWYTVCTERAIGLEIVSGAPDGIPR